jgi:hypothetical protein
MMIFRQTKYHGKGKIAQIKIHMTNKEALWEAERTSGT